jgi:Flp pilus assembly protein CpaB
MSVARNRVLLRLGRWPRRCIAAACLILAAESAFAHRTSAGTHRLPGLAARLHPGQVAVPVVLDEAVGHYLHPGDRVGIYARSAGDLSTQATPAELIADHVEVLSLPPPPDGSTDQVIIIAADRGTATRVANSVGSTKLAVLDNSSS